MSPAPNGDTSIGGSILRNSTLRTERSKKKIQKCGHTGSAQRRAGTNVRCRPNALKSMVDYLSEEQKSWVRELGFGEMLKVGNLKIDRRLCYWLCEKFDTDRLRLDVREGSSIRISSNQVGWVLGIPAVSSGAVVDFLPSEKSGGENYKRLLARYNGDAGASECLVLKKIRESSSKDEFQQDFLLYALGVFLCPTQCSKFSPRLMSAVADMKLAREYNWAEFVLRWLVRCIERFKVATLKFGKSSGLGGCVMFLMLLYLDHLDNVKPLSWGVYPRVATWNRTSLRAAIAADRYKEGGFGRREVVSIKYGSRHPLQAEENDWEFVRNRNVESVEPRNSVTVTADPNGHISDVVFSMNGIELTRSDMTMLLNDRGEGIIPERFFAAVAEIVVGERCRSKDIKPRFVIRPDMTGPMISEAIKSEFSEQGPAVASCILKQIVQHQIDRFPLDMCDEIE